MPLPWRSWSRRRRLVVVLVAEAALVVVLVLAGLAAGSVAVLAAAVDAAGDTAALVVSIVAVTLGERAVGERARNRPIAVAALVNGSGLVAVTAVVAIDAIRRLIAGAPEVYGPAMVGAGVVTVLVLVGCAVVLHDVADDDVHLRAVFLDTLADAGAAAGVAVSGTVLAGAPRLAWLDPAVALAISVVVLIAAAPLVRDAVRSLQRTGGAAAG